jgi:hypothetical protein
LGLAKGQAQGRAEGRAEGGAEVLLTQLRQQIGKLERPAIVAIRALPLNELKQLGKALFKFQSHADLDSWLQARTAVVSATQKAASVSAQRPLRKVKKKN